MANYPQELAQDAVCQSHIGHMTGLWFLPTRPLRLNTNYDDNLIKDYKHGHSLTEAARTTRLVHATNAAASNSPLFL